MTRVGESTRLDCEGQESTVTATGTIERSARLAEIEAKRRGERRTYKRRTRKGIRATQNKQHLPKNPPKQPPEKTPPQQKPKQTQNPQTQKPPRNPHTPQNPYRHISSCQEKRKMNIIGRKAQLTKKILENCCS